MLVLYYAHVKIVLIYQQHIFFKRETFFFFFTAGIQQYTAIITRSTSVTYNISYSSVQMIMH